MKVIKFIKDNIFWVLVVSIPTIIIIVAVIFTTPGERTFLEQIGYEIGKIGKAIADGFGGK